MELVTIMIFYNFIIFMFVSNMPDIAFVKTIKSRNSPFLNLVSIGFAIINTIMRKIYFIV